LKNNETGLIMDKLIKVLYAPNKSDRHGTYKLLYQHKDSTYEAHVTPEEYKVRILKQKFIFEKKYSKKDILEFEEAVRDMVNEEHFEND